MMSETTNNMGNWP